MSDHYTVFDTSAVLEVLSSTYKRNIYGDYLVFHDLLGSNSNDDLFSRRCWNLKIDATSGETKLSIIRVLKLIQIEDKLPSNHELIEHLKYGKGRFPEKEIERAPLPTYRVYKENETKTLESFTAIVNSEAIFLNKIARYLLEDPLRATTHNFRKEVFNWLHNNEILAESNCEIDSTSLKLTVPNPLHGKVNSLIIEVKGFHFCSKDLLDLEYLLRDLLIPEKVIEVEEDSTLRELFDLFSDPGPRQIPGDYKEEIMKLPSSKLGEVFSTIRKIKKKLQRDQDKSDWREFQYRLKYLKKSNNSDVTKN